MGLVLPLLAALDFHLDVRTTPNSPSAGRAAMRVGTVLVAAVILAWPAFYNRYPLLYPDSVSYLGDGSSVARAVFLHQFSEYYGFRSLIYSLGILGLHWNVTPWPIIAFNALLTSYVFWLLLRSLFFSGERASLYFAVLVLSLSLFTGLGWLVGWVMPDLFGPLLYLSIFLLVFARGTLSATERVLTGLIAWWGIVSHSTHLLLGSGLCIVLVGLSAAQGSGLRHSLREVRLVAAILVAAILAQVGLNAYLYRQLSLNGNRPPFLLARVIVDGPGRWYLRKHCASSHLLICDRLEKLPDNVDEILWGDEGWSEASTEDQQELSHEEMTVVMGVVRDYPRDELRLCWNHFWRQLLTYGVYSYDANAWLGENIDAALPGQGNRYRHSRQAQGELHENFFTSMQNWAVTVSLFVIVIGLWILFARRLWSRRLAALTVIVIYAALANAAVTGNFSDVEDRLQARVVWLVPLLACTFILTWIDHRFSGSNMIITARSRRSRSALPNSSGL